mgnify:CR=1 FL=1
MMNMASAWVVKNGGEMIPARMQEAWLRLGLREAARRGKA